MDIPLSVFPAVLILRLQVWKRRKNLAGKCPPPDSDPFNVNRFLAKPCGAVKSGVT